MHCRQAWGRRVPQPSALSSGEGALETFLLKIPAHIAYGLCHSSSPPPPTALLSIRPFTTLQVPCPEAQHRVMQEAVENHMPQAIIIDEIGTEAECEAARTIAQRGETVGAGAEGGNVLMGLHREVRQWEYTDGIRAPVS